MDFSPERTYGKSTDNIASDSSRAFKFFDHIAIYSFVKLSLSPSPTQTTTERILLRKSLKIKTYNKQLQKESETT